MSNPGVITLTKTRVCGQEVKIEDNLGEAIHIHYGQIRIDLSVKEFEKLGTSVEFILDQMNELIPANNIGWRDLNPIFLQNPKNTDMLFKLQRAYVATVKLRDIYVDAYIQLPLVGRVPTYRPLKQSKVVKALGGKCKDNDEYKQLNEIFETNSGRVQKNMDIIEKKGYPTNGQYIILNKDNMIIDGQHRSACLYYIYGPDHEIPVMKWEFEDENHLFFPKKRSVAEVAIRSYIGLMKRGIFLLIRLPFRAINKIKKLSYKTKGRADQEYRTVLYDISKNPEDIYLILNGENIPFIRLDSDVMALNSDADIALLVDYNYKGRFEKCMLQKGFVKEAFEEQIYEYLYSLKKDGWYKNDHMKVHVYYQMMCKSLYEEALLPLSPNIEKVAWNTRQYDQKQMCYQPGQEIKTLLCLIQCVYFEKGFAERRKKQLSEGIEKLNQDIFREMLYEIFYRFTDRLMYLMNDHRYEDILEEYRCFKKY